MTVEQLFTIPKWSSRIIVEARQTLELRCLCNTCLALDARFPDSGYQLALFPRDTLLGPLALVKANRPDLRGHILLAKRGRRNGDRN